MLCKVSVYSREKTKIKLVFPRNVILCKKDQKQLFMLYTLIDNTLQSSRTILGFRSIKKALVTIVQLHIMFDGTQLFGSNKILLPQKISDLQCTFI